VARDHASGVRGWRIGAAAEVLGAFSKLGVLAFGGPVAHLGYFREEFVRRRAWLDETAFADLVALCQFLPGPASSQVGFALGWRRAGPLGALAAWTGFTLPSAVLMTAFAFGAPAMGGPLGDGVIHGLKLVAVAVVAQAVVSMARILTPNAPRLAVALAALVVVRLAPAGAGQIPAIALGAAAGLLWLRGRRDEGAPDSKVSKASPRIGLAALTAYLVLLIGGPLLEAATASPVLARFDAFYRSGALVFGGGHVVLPLLKHAVVDPGWVSQDNFLAGYGAAQALPGPLFTFAAYLGASMGGPAGGVAGAVLGLISIFLPGLLALTAALPFWGWLRRRPLAQAAMAGANAAVVGVLAAAFYDPVWKSAVEGPGDVLAAAVGFMLLAALEIPPLLVVLLGVGLGLAGAL
jgi:chromate transporter